MDIGRCDLDLGRARETDTIEVIGRCDLDLGCAEETDNIDVISYHIISYHIISYHIISYQHHYHRYSCKLQFAVRILKVVVEKRMKIIINGVDSAQP